MRRLPQWATRATDLTEPAACTLPCSPTPGDRVPADATERLGPVEYWTCPKHGSHSGQRRMFSWHDGQQALGLWEWTNVG